MDRTPRDVIARYCDLFKAKYGINPPIGGKQAGIAKQLHQLYAWDHIDGLLTTYFQMHDEFIENSGHSLEVFRGCLPKVIAEWTKRRKQQQVVQMPCRECGGGGLIQGAEDLFPRRCPCRTVKARVSA